MPGDTVCQRPPADYQEKLESFVLYVSQEIAFGKYGSNMIYGSNVTAVWIDPPRRTTLAPRGSRHAPVKSLEYTRLKKSPLCSRLRQMAANACRTFFSIVNDQLQRLFGSTKGNW